MKKTVFITITLLILIALGLFAYWYFLVGGTAGTTTGNTPAGFNPFGTNNSSNNNGTGTTGTQTHPQTSTDQPFTSTSTASTVPAKMPVLRLLSEIPVGGYGASTTASTTIVRWVDRGRGNIYEAREDEPSIATLSNTLIPRIYESLWNQNATAFVGFRPAEDDSPRSIYAELKPATATSSASSTSAANSVTPYELKGSALKDDILAYAVSPKKDKTFFLVSEGSKSVGYIYTFNQTKGTRIFDTPLTQVNVEWPEENTIAITTKGSAFEDGFLYFVNPKTGTWKKVLGPLKGLSTKTSHNAKYVIASSANGDGITSIAMNTMTGSSTDAGTQILADKCAWGNFYKELLYCAIPTTEVASGTYPDDWYKGRISFSDSIWQLNIATGEDRLISALAGQSGKNIDGYDLGLDPRDDYLMFMNKNDLSLWSIDLVSAK